MKMLQMDNRISSRMEIAAGKIHFFFPVWEYPVGVVKVCK